MTLRRFSSPKKLRGLIGYLFPYSSILNKKEQAWLALSSFQKRARKHGKYFRRPIERQIEGFAGNRSFTLFAAVLPARPAVVYFEMFFDGRLHVIIAMAVVFDWHTGPVEFPCGDNVIAATAVVVRVFSAHGAIALNLHRLHTNRVALNENFVRMPPDRQTPACGSKELVAEQTGRNHRDASDKHGKLPFAPVGKDLDLLR